MRILLVEDEVDYREALRDMLNMDGFTTDAVGSIASCEYWLTTHECDVLLIDRVLPDGDGIRLLSSPFISAQTIKIMLTAKGQVHDRISGLEADADYYLVKPVNYDELRALLKRLHRKHIQMQKTGDWRLDCVTAQLFTPNAMGVALTRREVSVLSVFIDQTGCAMPRWAFIHALNESPEAYDPRRLEVLIRRLRDKVEAQTQQVLPICSVYGVGYSFNGILVT